jgi:hypothetical protein
MITARRMLSVVLLALSCSFALAQSAPDGHWEGTLVLPNRELDIVVDIVKNAKGEWLANFGIPSQKAPELAISKLAVEGKTVTFQIDGAPGKPVFDGTVSADGKMKATLLAEGQSLPMQLIRTGDGKIEAPPSSPALAAAFEGDWAGDMETPKGVVSLVLHLRNQPDKTVKASLDSLSQKALGLRVVDVVQTGNKLSFRLSAVEAGFSGHINKRGTEISGDWSQGPGALPMKFSKVEPKP